ncbi:UNVERIFIED_CONTAM: hypothetical protein PYX00_010446 [Menopon gallinae]|uniref:J domain-containing protein n=1 Tax=Menopon gallinae TaxID=328185 RepID=A0AAW2HFX1_9NEOP
MFSRIGPVLRIGNEIRYFSIARALRNHYDTLGLKPAATAAEIKNAYYEKTKLYHPDTSSASPESVKKFREISEAYEVLGSPASRREYDERVLGIIRDDTDEGVIVEDPIELYKRRKSSKPDSMHTWTQQHCENLRKKHQENVQREGRKIDQETSPYPPEFKFIVSLLVLLFFYSLKKDEE